MAWRTIPSPLSKMKRRLDSTEATRGLQEIRVAGDLHCTQEMSNFRKLRKDMGIPEMRTKVI